MTEQLRADALAAGVIYMMKKRALRKTLFTIFFSLWCCVAFADTTTSNLGLTLPTNFGGTDSFGAKLNTNFTTIDTNSVRKCTTTQVIQGDGTCVANAGGGGSGDVEDVWSCTTGSCQSITLENGDTFNVDVDATFTMDDSAKIVWGTGSDVQIFYGGTGQYLEISTLLGASNTVDDAMYVIAADADNDASDDMTANQEIFEIGKGGGDDSEANFVELFAVDEDGDVTIAGSLTVGGSSALFSDLSFCKTFEEVKAADNDLALYIPDVNITLAGGRCQCVGTCTTAADMILFTRQVGTGTEDAVTGTITCEALGTADTEIAFSGGAGQTVAAGDVVFAEVNNTPAPQTDTYILCVNYTVD